MQMNVLETKGKSGRSNTRLKGNAIGTREKGMTFIEDLVEKSYQQVEFLFWL